MILCIDIGNTRTKIGVVDAGRVRRVEAVLSDAPASACENAVRRALRGAGDVRQAWYSSVRPASNARFERAVARGAKIPLERITHKTPAPVTLRVHRPERVGTDRLCAACGAVQDRRRSAIVIDAGSAITVNLVLDRHLLAGIIMAGPSISLAALHAFTAGLPKLDYAAGSASPPRLDDTESAMRWGASLAAAGGIQAAVGLLEAKAEKRLPVVLTGGHSGRLHPFLPPRWELVPDLTLLGIAAIAHHAY